MSVILILILASLTLALAFLAGFIWAVRSGQYEDTFTPSLRVLTEEENTTSPPHPGPLPVGRGEGEGAGASGNCNQFF